MSSNTPKWHFAKWYLIILEELTKPLKQCLAGFPGAGFELVKSSRTFLENSKLQGDGPFLIQASLFLRWSPWGWGVSSDLECSGRTVLPFLPEETQ